MMTNILCSYHLKVMFIFAYKIRIDTANINTIYFLQFHKTSTNQKQILFDLLDTGKLFYENKISIFFPTGNPLLIRY